MWGIKIEISKRSVIWILHQLKQVLQIIPQSIWNDSNLKNQSSLKVQSITKRNVQKTLFVNDFQLKLKYLKLKDFYFSWPKNLKLKKSFWKSYLSSFFWGIKEIKRFKIKRNKVEWNSLLTTNRSICHGSIFVNKNLWSYWQHKSF